MQKKVFEEAAYAIVNKLQAVAAARGTPMTDEVARCFVAMQLSQHADALATAALPNAAAGLAVNKPVAAVPAVEVVAAA